MISYGVRILPSDQRAVELSLLYTVEFAVNDITEISWNGSLFNHLAIQPKRKNLIQALVLPYLQQTPEYSFDDFVEGKGRGLIFLF